MLAIEERTEEWRRLARCAPDPPVRRRAQALFLLAQGTSVLAVARWLRTAPHRVRAWRGWFLAGGRDQLADDPRAERPPKLGPAERTLLDEALERGPQADGWPVTA